MRLGRRALLLTALAAAAAPLPCAAGFNFFTSQYSASRDELQAQVARQFPLRQRYAELFAVTLSEPQLTLEPARNRLALAAHLSIESPLLPDGVIQGDVAISSALTYDAATLALRLQQPTAERLTLQGVGGRDAENLQRIGAAVAEQVLQGQVLRRFTPEELRFGRKTYRIGTITVLADGITVELE